MSFADKRVAPPIGVLSVGDSLANGHGDMAAGVPAQSWGLWIAESMFEPFTKAGLGGLASTEILQRTETLDLRSYAIATLNVGTNDALRGVQGHVFARSLDAILYKLVQHSARVVVSELHVRIGRPGRDAAALNDVLLARCAERGALAVPVAGLDRMQFMQGDRVHFNALGQLELADRAANVLGIRPPSEIAARFRRPRGGMRLRYAFSPTSGAVRYAAQGALRQAITARRFESGEF